VSYERQAAAALRMLTRAGRKVTILRPPVADVDGVADTPGTPGEPIAYSAVAVLTPGKATSDGPEPGTLVITRSRLMLVSALTPTGKTLEIEPQVGDVIELGNVEWKVLGNTPVAPDGDVVILHRVLVER